MDVVAVILSFFISIYFGLGIIFYILASRAYSYRGIRLKKYPFAGYLTVVIFQGAVTFWLVYHGSHEPQTLNVPITGMLASSLLIGGFYPLTQVYQHEADAKDGVKSISSWLGYRGTFLFTAIIYAIAFIVLAFHFLSNWNGINFLCWQPACCLFSYILWYGHESVERCICRQFYQYHANEPAGIYMR